MYRHGFLLRFTMQRDSQGTGNIIVGAYTKLCLTFADMTGVENASGSGPISSSAGSSMPLLLPPSDLGHRHARLYRVRDPDTDPSPEIDVRARMVSALQAPALMVCVLRYFASVEVERVLCSHVLTNSFTTCYIWPRAIMRDIVG